MKTHYKHLFLAALLFVRAATLMAQAPTDSLDAIVNKAAARFMANPAAVGVSIGIYHNGKMYTYNFGEQHKGKGDLPTATTLYEIASITKTFTGSLLAKAVLEHRIKLEDDIRKYLDGSYPNLEYQGHFITVAMLLNHRSGIPFMLPDDPIYKAGDNLKAMQFQIDLYKHYTKKDFLNDLHQVKLDTVPGTKFGYSNAAAILCGYLLEKLYGMGYDQLLKEQLTKMLLMDATKINLSAGEMKEMPAGYDEKGALMPYAPNQIEGAGALKSSVADMLKYISWHLDEKKNPAALLTHQPTWQSGNYWAGLNWQVVQAADKNRLIWQSGDLVGFACYCALYPEANLGIVVLTNEEGHQAPGLIEKLIDPVAAYLEPGAIPFP